MAERRPGWVDGIGAAEARLATGVLACPEGRITARTGIRPTDGFPGDVSLTNGVVTVTPFQAVVQDETSSAGGAYLVTLDEPRQLTLDPPDGPNARIDLVVAAVDPEAPNGFAVRVVSRGAGSPPPEPQRPANAISLGRITINPNGTYETISLARQGPWTCAIGGILVVWGEQNRPTNPNVGMYIHRVDTGHLERCTGPNTWQTIDLTDTGWQTLPLRRGTTTEPGWAPWTATGEGFPGLQIRRIGRVAYTRGRVGPEGGPATSGSVICTVPAGLRPVYTTVQVVPRRRGGEVVNAAVVPSTGALRMYDSTLQEDEFITLDLFWALD